MQIRLYFFTTKLCSLKATMTVLIGFDMCYIPSTDGLSCSELKFIPKAQAQVLWFHTGICFGKVLLVPTFSTKILPTIYLYLFFETSTTGLRFRCNVNINKHRTKISYHDPIYSLFQCCDWNMMLF